ncbi:hypothetical protein CU666_23770 [Pseudomonas syringae pv. actinidifoliorum]|uniref:MarB protein n=1 Tax=Pseudomonas syringae pv. actinidiae ICMP 18807 TaxID=1194404 RepID=S6VJX8_PSESF|nr:hypothetical protein [Pseudomonas syringae]EPN51535.1 hypothetical protein A244_17881 [Pseudomonas syringae pv. actinidiae ICMP 18807]NAT15823.1 hypothetical protein [Pseudomonas syringae pv. actinidifoliorum]NAT60805.1 hypothetical protein [Pseudomonas syringae pv. actinidifoliorum]
MIKTKLTALTLAGLMAVASGVAFADTSTNNLPAASINKNATKLPGTTTEPTDRNASSTPGAQTDSKKAAADKAAHDKAAHGTHDNNGVTQKSEVK